MDVTPQQILTLAAKYIGYKEKASDKDLYSFDGNAGSGNCTMFQSELDRAGFWNNAKQGYEWCTSFVAWCFWRIAGSEAKEILCLTGPYGASCISWAAYYRAQGRLFSTPEVGDQYFTRDKDGEACHTGIVERVDGNTFVTIEGNSNNMVRRVKRTLDNTVYGFGRPKYATEDNMTRYQTINDMPEWAQDDIKALVEGGYLKGDGSALDLSEDMIRTLIICKRMMEGTGK